MIAALIHDSYFPLYVAILFGCLIGVGCVLIKGEKPYQPEDDNFMDRHW